MSVPSSSQIRQQFIDYFVKKCGHTFVPSSPCVPHDDPTLMFTNAGMNQFKPIFLGTADPKSEFGRLKRAVNTQKCIRAGGKHNDLDDVGHDTYHHTFFEMLGNWSFGDYFKKDAIEWAWDLLTRMWGVDPERLHATYFQGDAAEGLEPDSEARDLWAKILPPGRIHPGNKKDNFWEMGDTGPCGPCSEIHIDLTEDKSGGPLVNAGDAKVMEIWNLVFIQFNRAGDGKLTPLPAKHVDTGMGFERITSLLQGKKSNYDTDIFTPIFAAIQRVTGAAEYTGLLEQRHEGTEAPAAAGKLRHEVMKDVAYRVVADHLRTLTFALTDGATPSNEGRGYVLRRILRRAVRYGRQYFGTREPFICKLVPAVVEAMGAAFPDLKKDSSRVAEIIRDEEQSFIKTLDRGIALFEEAAQHAVTHHHGRIGGEHAFKLHDTYGFPVDLTELMAEERGLTVNIGEYERLMEEARERARGESKSDDSELQEEKEKDRKDAESKKNTTFDEDKYRAELECDARIVTSAFSVPVPGTRTAKSGCSIVAGLDKTCMYVEQGGQVSDMGWIRTDTGQIEVGSLSRHVYVIDGRRHEHIQHIGRVIDGEIWPGSPCRVIVDRERRLQIMKNHTATHVMNWALREVLGDHVQQKGSLVDPDKTRFDLSHHAAISDEELKRIEELTNEQIKKDLKVDTNDNVPVDQKSAMKINGLRAVFGEKYPDQVRVVSIGVPVKDLLAKPDNPDWRKYSIEFCGGTHVKSTGEIGRFRLIEESAVAKGIRRVTGVTGERAFAAEKEAEALLREIDAALDDASRPLTDGRGSDQERALTAMIARLNSTEQPLPIIEKFRLRVKLAELQELAKKAAKQQARSGAADVMARADRLLESAEKIGGHAILVGELGSANVEQLRGACDSLRSRAGSAAILLAAENEGKVVLLAAMTPDVVAKGVKAGDLIKEIAPLVGGKGGGKPDIAQGGGSDVSKIGEAIAVAEKWLRGRLA